jgi:hypothetical protein
MEEELRNAEDADRRKKEEERLRALALAAPAPAPIVEAEALSPAPEAVLFDEAKASSETTSIEAASAFTEVESPYPGEALYPVQPSAEVEITPEEAYPLIHPPTTGEQVPSLRRTTLAAQVKATEETGDEISPETSVSADVEPAEQNSPVTEHTSQDA